MEKRKSPHLSLSRYGELLCIQTMVAVPMESFCFLTLGGGEGLPLEPGTTRTVLLTLAGEMVELMPPNLKGFEDLEKVTSLRFGLSDDRHLIVTAVKRVPAGTTHATVLDLKKDGSVVVRRFNLEFRAEGEPTTKRRFSWKSVDSGISFSQ